MMLVPPLLSLSLAVGLSALHPTPQCTSGHLSILCILFLCTWPSFPASYLLTLVPAALTSWRRLTVSLSPRSALQHKVQHKVSLGQPRSATVCTFSRLFTKRLTTVHRSRLSVHLSLASRSPDPPRSLENESLVYFRIRYRKLRASLFFISTLSTHPHVNKREISNFQACRPFRSIQPAPIHFQDV